MRKQPRQPRKSLRIHQPRKPQGSRLLELCMRPGRRRWRLYRLIAVVLGEPYRPPVNLQDRIDRLQRARDIMLPYRYDSFERALDLSAINVELVQLGRMLDEL